MRKPCDIFCKEIFFSPKFVLQCFFKLQASEEVLGHWLQGNGFSPECIIKCVFKCTLFEKFLGHWLQGNDFSAECVLKSCLKCSPFEKALGHLGQGRLMRKTYDTDCKWFFTKVNSHVMLQIYSIWESFRALRTRKWFFTRVCM